MKLKKLLTVCSWCGVSSFFLELYCDHCWQRVLSFADPIDSIDRRVNMPIMLKSIFPWEKNASPMVNSLIMSLKGGGWNERFLDLARLFYKYHGKPDSKKKFYFVPAPEKFLGRMDHAYLWAEALSQFFGGDITPLLLRANEAEQKSLTAMKRRERKVVLSDWAMQWLREQEGVGGAHWIFVDDVFTTGSTARAVFKALGEPEYFEAWTIAHRSFLP